MGDVITVITDDSDLEDEVEDEVEENNQNDVILMSDRST